MKKIKFLFYFLVYKFIYRIVVWCLNTSFERNSHAVSSEIKLLYAKILPVSHIKIMYEKIMPVSHIKILYEKINEKDTDLKHINKMFDLHVVNNMFYVRDVYGKHGRHYKMIICERKNAKTIFMLTSCITIEGEIKELIINTIGMNFYDDYIKFNNILHTIN
ncbi:MAG: hypothetical protein WC389_05460 [Lutibacter sp.]|jgi:hypothetical protein